MTNLQFHFQNKKTSSGHNNLIIRHDLTSKTSTNLRNKNLTVASEYLKRSASLLKNSPAHYKVHTGHPDIYFKQTLRNYDYFKIENPEKLKLQISYSSESLKEVNKSAWRF